MAIRNDLTGKKFGMLTVVKELGKNKILCRCDCGVTKEWKMARVKNVVGKRFGKLVVLEELTGGRVLCKCDCGNTKDINKAHLLNGDIQSCGCLLAMSGINNSKPFLTDNTNVSMLRSAVQKAKPQKNSNSGVRGVCWNERKGKWCAHIGFKGQKINLGMFDTISEAAATRKAAEEYYYKPVIAEWEKEKDQE